MATLLRQVILPFVPFLFPWLWWNNKKGPEGTEAPQEPDVFSGTFRTSGTSGSSVVVGLLITIAVIAALIAPWTVRNYRAFGRFVLLNTNAGYAFFWANHPVHGSNFIAIFPEDISYQGLIPDELRALDEAALDQALLREGLRFVVEDPLRYVPLSLSRVKDYFKFWPSRQSSLISNIARVSSFGACLPLMLYGLWLSAVGGRLSAQGLLPSRSLQAGGRSAVRSLHPAVTLLWLFVAVYTAIHLLSWALIRYRLPVDAVLIVFAAYGLMDLGLRVSQAFRCQQ